MKLHRKILESAPFIPWHAQQRRINNENLFNNIFAPHFLSYFSTSTTTGNSQLNTQLHLKFYADTKFKIFFSTVHLERIVKGGVTRCVRSFFCVFLWRKYPPWHGGLLGIQEAVQKPKEVQHEFSSAFRQCECGNTYFAKIEPRG